ncbi:hypothetical protein Sjap_017317 [Stephania japonica]|uniref:F-box protein At3g26010-like beta-propeller domain-containing protein n=1 Tax=Stephania japonica TaxID=461633 RepID=A0AAP0I5Z3_9MAGN
MAQFYHTRPSLPNPPFPKVPQHCRLWFLLPWIQAFHLQRCSAQRIQLVRTHIHVKLSGCTNGLVYGTLNHYTEIFISNHITKHTVYIPNPKNHRSLGLATNPYNPDFGFTMVSVGFSREDHGVLKFEVYSPKTAEWRASKNDSMIPAYYHLFLRKHQVVFTGGNKIYWSLVLDILWFDFEKEVAGLIECPDIENLFIIHPLQHRSFTAIGVCDGELSYIKLTKKGEVEVWLLREKKQ